MLEAILKDIRKLALMLTFLENAIFQKRFLFLNFGSEYSQISISLENLLLNEEMQNYSLKGHEASKHDDNYLTQNQNVDSYVNITVRASYKFPR